MKPKLIFLRLLTIILLSMIIGLLGCKEKDDKIKVGVILPLSGDFANYGTQCKNGIEFAALQFDNIQLFFEDSKGDIKTTVSAYNKLTRRNKVDLIIGDMFSGTTQAIAPLANKDQVILISPTASSKEIPRNGIYSLSVFPNEEFEGKYLADFCNTRFENIGIFNENVAASEAIKNSFIEDFNGNVAFVESFSSQTQNFRELILKHRNIKTDAIFLITYTNHALNIIRQIHELGITGNILGQSALFDPNFFEQINFIETDLFTSGPSFSEISENKEILLFFDEYYEVYNEKPNQMSSQGYIAVKVGLDFFNAFRQNEYSEAFIQNYKLSSFIGDVKFSDGLYVESGLSIYSYDGKVLQLIK